MVVPQMWRAENGGVITHHSELYNLEPDMQKHTTESAALFINMLLECGDKAGLMINILFDVVLLIQIQKVQL